MNAITIDYQYRNDLSKLVDAYHSKPINDISIAEFFTKVDTLKACRDWALQLLQDNAFVLDEPEEIRL